MTSREPGDKALAAIDEVLAKRPKKDDDALSRATLCLTEWREQLTPGDLAAAPAAQRERLARLNSIVSVVMGVHFPLGPPPWKELENARAWLADLLADFSDASSPELRNMRAGQ